MNTANRIFPSCRVVVSTSRRRINSIFTTTPRKIPEQKLKYVTYLFQIFFLFLINSSLAYATDDNYLLKMPGKLVSVGDHRLHIFCAGAGTPTVIIDSGLGGFSLEWINVQSRLSKNMRVCTYDRAGYGWSDPGPEPRTTQQIAQELKLLLTNAQVPGPYILVGHSFGGYNIRYYASIHPEEVLGLVLVDASHPEQFKRLPQVEKKTEIKRKNSWTMQLSRPVIPENYPERARRLAFVLMSTYKAAQAQKNEWDNFKTSARQVVSYENLPDVPLTVVTRGKRVWPHNEFGDESERAWSEMQNELCYLNSHSVHVIAKNSGHLVHLDEPELLVSAIISTTVSAVELEETRLADLQRRKVSPGNDITLHAGNYPKPLHYAFSYPLYNIYDERDISSQAKFVLPY